MPTCASSKLTEAGRLSHKDLAGMRVKDLKLSLTVFGVDYSKFCEKIEFVESLRMALKKHGGVDDFNEKDVVTPAAVATTAINSAELSNFTKPLLPVDLARLLFAAIGVTFFVVVTFRKKKNPTT